MAIRAVQVGLGPWGLNWAQQVTPKISQIEIVAYVARSPDSLTNAQEVLSMSPELFHSSLESALSSVEADAVMILTNTSAHTTLAETALLADKHVLIEKPFTETVSEARRLSELAQNKRRVLMVNQNFRYFPATLAALDIVRKKELGPLSSIDVDFRWYMDFPSYEAGRFHYEREQALLIDLSVHHFDLMRLMTESEASCVYCRAWQPPGSRYQDPASAAAIIEFRNGVTVNYRASWLSRGTPTTFSGDWRMEFERGEVQWKCRKDRDLTTDGDAVVIKELGQRAKKVQLEPPDHFGRAGVLVAFVNAIKNGAVPYYFSSAIDNVGTVRLMQGALKSATEQSIVTFK